MYSPACVAHSIDKARHRIEKRHVLVKCSGHNSGYSLYKRVKSVQLPVNMTVRQRSVDITVDWRGASTLLTILIEHKIAVDESDKVVLAPHRQRIRSMNLFPLSLPIGSRRQHESTRSFQSL